MTYTEEELEALANAAGVRWKTEISSDGVLKSNRWYVWLANHATLSYGETRREAMNHYWNRYINGEVKPYK
jgi:hypothetical protein